jgi:hypothetical protein
MTDIPTPSESPAPQQIPLATLAYVSPAQNRRPGVLTAVGIMSIVIGCFSGLVSFSMGMQAIVFYGLSRSAAFSSAPSSTVMTTTVNGNSVVSTTSIGPSGPVSATSATVALTPAQAGTVVVRVQSMVNNAMTPAQVATLQAELQMPGQQLLAPQFAWSPISSAMMQPNGSVMIFFNGGARFGMNGGMLVIDSAGKVVTQTATANVNLRMPLFPRVSNSTTILVGVEAVLSILLAIYLLVAGILLLRDSPNSRKRHLRYAIIKIVLAIIGGAGIGMMYGGMISSMPTPGASLAPMRNVLVGVYFAFFAAMGCAYPIALLITFNVGAARNYYAMGGGGKS